MNYVMNAEEQAYYDSLTQFQKDTYNLWHENHQEAFWSLPDAGYVRQNYFSTSFYQRDVVYKKMQAIQDHLASSGEKSTMSFITKWASPIPIVSEIVGSAVSSPRFMVQF